MSKRILKDLEIEAALEEIFGLPSDPEDSEDGEESEEEDVQYNSVKLQRVLEEIDEPLPLPGLRSTARSSIPFPNDAGSPTPSSMDARSPTPSSFVAGSPAPSLLNAVSPIPSSMCTRSPTPSSMDARSPISSYNAIESSVRPSYVRKPRTLQSTGSSLSSTNADSLTAASQLSNRSAEASESQNFQTPRTVQIRGRGRNRESRSGQRVGRCASRGNSRDARRENSRGAKRGNSRGARRGNSLGRRQTNSVGRVRGNVRRAEATRRQREELPDNDSSEGESDANEDEWTKKSWADRPHFQPSSFDQIPMRPKRILPANTRPIRYFEKFFTDEVFELIVTQTNLYAIQQNIIGWTPVDGREFKAFLGILIIMGYHVLPSIDLYWSSDPDFRVNEIASTMTAKRFKQILRCLHLNDNTQCPARTSPEFDKLFKLRPLLTLINQACQENAHDSSSQSIDESMILFKGRSSLKQYMPMKPIKRGFKVWCRCDSSSGYLYEFDVYTGKIGDRVEEGLGANVVKKLTEKIIENDLDNIHVTFDNFFCDYSIMEYLYDSGIFATGTVRRARADMPKLIKGKKNLNLNKGEYKWRVKEDVGVVIWQDTKEVLVMSNAFHPTIGETTVMRTQKDGTKLPLACPAAIKEYTKRMGGVDTFDQIKSTYSVGRRSKRWWLRIFYFVLDLSITNAFLIYGKNCNTTKLSNLEFRVALSRGLIGGFTSRKRHYDGSNYINRKKVTLSDNYQKSQHMVPPETRFTNVGDHMPCELPSYKRCRMCSTKLHDKRSKIMCRKCNVPLCITPCFYKFHKEK